MEKIFKEKLYHGTCEANLNLTKEELDYKRKVCTKVADICYEFLKTKYNFNKLTMEPPESGDDAEFYYAATAFYFYHKSKDGSRRYEYGDYYLCSSLMKVKHSWATNKIFGEIGERAYLMLGLCEKYGEFSNYINDEILDYINKFKKLPNKSKQIILEFENVPISLLLTEAGDPISQNDNISDNQNYRVKQEDVDKLMKYKTNIIYNDI